MTIKEIAELCGVKENDTIRNWINHEDFLSRNFRLRDIIREKLKGGSPEKPSDYDLEETLAIIRGGGNETLASLLAENAENKNAIALSNGINAKSTFDIDKLVNDKISSVLSSLITRKDNPRNVVNAYNNIIKALSLMKKWRNGFYIAKAEDLDKVYGLLISARDYLSE